MVETPDNEFRRKACFDLWMHQNNLLWSRFQLLYIVQGSFFLAVPALKNTPIFIGIALLLTLYLTGWLYNTVDQDRRLRNDWAEILKKEFNFDPLPAKQATTPGVLQGTLEIIFQVSIFIPLAIVDLIAALYWATRAGA
jgi:hypothetical protein